LDLTIGFGLDFHFDQLEVFVKKALRHLVDWSYPGFVDT
jgi:hypothetical protein